MEDAMSEVSNVFPQMRMKANVDERQDSSLGQKQRVPEVTMKALEKLKEAVTQRKRSTLSLTESGKDGKSEMITSCSNPERNEEGCKNISKGWVS